MQLRQLLLLRNFSTARVLNRPSLSAQYKSKQLWNERFNCRVLSGDMDLIKAINSKILVGSELNNLEVDIFINIAQPRTGEIVQLQEAVNALKKFRRSLSAHTLLPSTSHATCRLFLDSQKPLSLVNLLEDRIKYGIFPDAFSFNLIFDETLERNDYALASRVAALIMLQEEFGTNQISDKLALYSVAKYIESKTNFTDWNKQGVANDPVFTGQDQTNTEVKQEEKTEAKKDEEEEEQEEEDAEYVRIPFLRNPYFDNHFDLTNPRVICGKTLSSIGFHLIQLSDQELGNKCRLIGDILQGKWCEAKEILDRCVQSNSKTGSIKELSKFYVENLHEVDAPNEDLKRSLLSGLDLLSDEGVSISKQVEHGCANFKELEEQDVTQLKANLVEWSELRIATKEAKDRLEEKKKLIEEIKAKKEELKLREQYLYFYDNLKKTNLTRIEYD